jgi:hypothetical protein
VRRILYVSNPNGKQRNKNPPRIPPPLLKWRLSLGVATGKREFNHLESGMQANRWAHEKPAAVKGPRILAGAASFKIFGRGGQTLNNRMGNDVSLAGDFRIRLTFGGGEVVN